MTNKVIKWGILGTGYIARKFADGLKVVENTKLQAVGSRNIDTAKAFATEYNVPAFYSSYEQVASDSEVDVVYIATPHNLHLANTLMCLEHGKAVLCEKPFAVNGSEVRQMIQKAQQANLFLMEALWSRFLPNILKTKEIIDSGKIGKVQFLAADFGLNTPFDPNHRHFNKELVGGSLLDLGIYPVFLSLFLLGKPKAFKAMAGIGSTGVDYNCNIALQYDDATIAVMYSSVVAKSDTIAEIHGEKGKIVFEKFWFCPVNIKIVWNDGSEEAIPLTFKGNGYNYEAQEVVNCMLAGKVQSDIMSWNHSLELIDMLDAIRKECGIVYPNHDK